MTTTSTKPLQIPTLTIADRRAIEQHVEWLRREPGARSLTAVLPSGAQVEIFADGGVASVESRD